MAVDLAHLDTFPRRHLGPAPKDVRDMLRTLGLETLDELVAETVPKGIRLGEALAIGPGRSEHEVLDDLRELAGRNQRLRSFLGMGYSDTFTPPVILRNVVENPGWYTAYTPYQAEVAQGRLEALLNFQTMISDLTGLEIANASMLDEATAAAEAMTMCFGIAGHDTTQSFFVSETCHPQSIDVIRTRAEPLGIAVIVGDHASFDGARKLFGALIQYPATDGTIHDYREFIAKAKGAGALLVVAADLLALTLLVPPGEFGADVAVGNTQRFGVPLGYGGPHAAYFATREAHVRRMPGRLIGLSRDRHGRPALRMAIQTREQHIRREKATSNICTAQVLLAVVASMYAVYHGPDGLKRIAERVHGLAMVLARGLRALGVPVASDRVFDTVRIDDEPTRVARWMARALERGMNLRRLAPGALTIALDETTDAADLTRLLEVFAEARPAPSVETLARETSAEIAEPFRRTSPYLTHPVFSSYHSETEMLRYLRKLESRDVSLTHSMIALGSCTMKLNATAEMIPITWPGFNAIHPFVPIDQARGYQELFQRLEEWLRAVTGFAAISLQPNAGSQGEYAGLLVIRRYHEARGDARRNLCLIPASAHGTNPASAVMAGFEVVVVQCDENGSIAIADLEAKARANRDRLGALMVTYPSTYGVFEEEIRRITEIVHDHGGQVYMDGANMNAQVGLCRPADVGADVCHLNLHKTFCIPHGGGGPGMGPIGVAPQLQAYLPRHPVIETGGAEGIGAVAGAPWSSASILTISYAYIAMMGGEGLTLATQVAILNANYVAQRLHEHFPVLYRGARGRVAHECILDTRPFKRTAGVEVEDIAKRLMDYGFHAPTVSFPVPGTIMVEPTESESRAELDRFCDAMIAIRGEIRAIEEGRLAREDNPLKNAPHTAEVVMASDWTHPYSREVAAYPAPWTRERKIWPAVGRIDGPYGDRNLVCACPPVAAYAPD